MEPIIAGATAVKTVQVVDTAGVAEPISGWEVTAAWIAGTAITQPATCTSVDATTWLVVAPTDGLAGRSVVLRVRVADPATGRVFITDAMFLVKG